MPATSAPSRSNAHASGRRSAGLGVPMLQPKLAPQWRLPAPVGADSPVCSARPLPDHLRPVHRITVEQIRHVPNAREPPLLTRRCRVAKVRGKGAQPRLVDALFDDPEQRPHGTVGGPRVGLRVDSRACRRARSLPACRGKGTRRWRRRRRSDRGWSRASSTVAG